MMTIEKVKQLISDMESDSIERTVSICSGQVKDLI